jgi:hypothetical protein
MKPSPAFLTFGTVGLLAALAPSVAASQGVGSAAAVKPSSTGTPPGGSARTLEIGTEIVSRERIQTSESGSLQVMFLDKTTMTVGPNSDLLIDEFVYDPGAGSGQFAASLTRGALRFVGGQISHTTGATINTPSATIGIRGGGLVAALNVPCGPRAKDRNASCDSYVCTGGECQFHSKIDNSMTTLSANEGILSEVSGITQFVATSVDMDISGGGGSSQSSSTPASTNSSLNTSNIEEAIGDIPLRAQEPPSPGPGGGSPSPPGSPGSPSP